MIRILGARGLLELSADSKFPSRMYFARLLSNSFLWMFRRGVNLPFHLSRMRGIMSRDEYRREVMRREGEISELCLILDSMRIVKDPAIRSLYKQNLNFKHDQREGCSRFYYKCLSRLDIKLFE